MPITASDTNTTPDYEFDALVDIAFNCGACKWFDKMAGYVNAHDYKLVPKFIKTYKNGHGNIGGESQKLRCLKKEFMMQATRLIVALSLASAVHAEDMAESCLQHLSGGAADVQCYTMLKKNQESEIKKIYAEIKIATRKNLEAYNEVNKYMDSVNAQMRACELKKLASNQWERVRDDTPNMTEHHYYDVVYRECQYLARKQQKIFLKDLIDLSDGK